MLRIGLFILLVLFSSTSIPEHTGRIYILFSNVVLNETVNADIYSVYSTITIDNADVNGDILSLSSKIYSYNGNKPTIRQIIPAFSLFLRNETTLAKSPHLVYDDSIPLIVVQFAFVIVQLFLLYIFISLKRNFVEQSALALRHQTKYVVTSGIMVYFAFLCLTLAFFVSIIAIPVSIMFVVLCFALVVAGQAPFSIAIGNFISTKIFERFQSHTIYTDLLIGMVIIFFFQTIPFVNLVTYFIALPVFCLGMLTTAWSNRHIRKIFYSSNYKQDESEVIFHKSKIRDMIIKEGKK